MPEHWFMKLPLLGDYKRLNAFESEWRTKCPKCGSEEAIAFICGSFGSNGGIKCPDCGFEWTELI